MSRQRQCLMGKLMLALVFGASAAISAGAALAQQYGAYPDAPLPGGPPQTPPAFRKIPPAVSPEYDEPDLVQPFTDPLTFNSDFQLFAPSDLSNYGGPPPANIGWYFSYDRLYYSINRPAQTQNGGDPFARPFDSKWVWGNRYSLGYMTREDHGWDVTFSRVRTGLLIDDPDLNLRLKPTFASIEINKTFRKKLRYGGELEPYFGIRYVYFADNTFDSSPSGPILVDGDGNPIPGPDGLPQAAGNEVFSQKMQNQLLGGQLGCRYHIRKGRWNLSTDGKLMAAQNYQYAQVRDVDTLLGVSEVNTAYSEFTPLGEFRANASYEISRDISLRFGFGLLHIARGILRADMAPTETNPNNPNINNQSTFLLLNNDQNLTVAGFTMGIEYNR